MNSLFSACLIDVSSGQQLRLQMFEQLCANTLGAALLSASSDIMNHVLGKLCLLSSDGDMANMTSGLLTKIVSHQDFATFQNALANNMVSQLIEALGVERNIVDEGFVQNAVYVLRLMSDVLGTVFLNII